MTNYILLKGQTFKELFNIMKTLDMTEKAAVIGDFGSKLPPECQSMLAMVTKFFFVILFWYIKTKLHVYICITSNCNFE